MSHVWSTSKNPCYILFKHHTTQKQTTGLGFPRVSVCGKPSVRSCAPSSLLCETVESMPEPSQCPIEGAGVGKIALLFMIKKGPNNSGMWRRWLHGVPGSEYSITVHAKEAQNVYAPLFKDNLITAVPTEWGDVSLVEAHLALLRAALKDPHNRYDEPAHLPAHSGACVFHDTLSSGASRTIF